MIIKLFVSQYRPCEIHHPVIILLFVSQYRPREIHHPPICQSVLSL